MDYNSIINYFTVVKQHGDKAQAICPAHKDKQASLSITYDKKESKTLLYCHAGCDTRNILDKVGLKISDLFDQEQIKLSKSKNNIESIYKYRDEKGNVIFEKIRFEPKRFSQRRYIEGATVWGLDEGIYYETFPGSNNWSMKARKEVAYKQFYRIDPVIYNLPVVISAIENKKIVYIVEGEKDADNLMKLGLVATTSFDGASKSKQKQKWRESYNPYFQNANVVLIPDNDEPGRAHMENIALNLIDITESIKIINLPGLNEKEDFTDWINKGYREEELQRLVENSPQWEPINNKIDILYGYNFSDVGNAERMAAIHGSNIRYNPQRNKWIIWSGKHWEIDDSYKVDGLAKDVIKRIQRAGDEILDDEEYKNFKKEVKRFVLKSENDARIRAMLNQTISQPGIIEKNTDVDPFLLNVSNGTLDLKTGKLKKHDRKDFITRLIDIKYDPKAKCYSWKEFLQKIFKEDNELIEFVQKSIGYSLTGSTIEQCFYMLYGNGANGKSTFLNTIEKILGDYSDTLKGSSLMIKRNDDGARGDLAKLKGKRFVIASELNEGQTFDESLLKSLTVGDIVPVRYLYGEEFPLVPQFKIWIGTNEKPKVKGSNYGIWRRVRLIPFLYTFKDEDKDTAFYEKFIEPELSGIFNWAVEGCMKYQEEGIEIPEKVLMAIEEYQNEMDSIGRFIDDYCVTGETFYIKASVFYNIYSKWCTENGEHEMSNVKFSKKLKEKGFSKIKNREGIHYLGIGIAELENRNPFEEDNVRASQ